MSYKADKPPQIDPTQCTYPEFVRYKRALDDYAAAVNAFPKPSNDVPIAMIQARFFNATGSAFSEFVRNLAGYTELLEPPALLELVRLQITGVRRDLQARAKLFRHQQTADLSCLVNLRRLRELLNETGYDKPSRVTICSAIYSCTVFKVKKRDECCSSAMQLRYL